MRDIYKEGLQRIRNEEGKVCDSYEICDHKACESSYRAWAIADSILSYGVMPEEEPT